VDEFKLIVDICLQKCSSDDVSAALAMIMREKWLGESMFPISVSTFFSPPPLADHDG
jgi:hypothetical protein